MNQESSVILRSRKATKNPVLKSAGSFATCLRRQALRMTMFTVFVFAVFFLGVGAMAQAQGIPLSPLQPELREEIIGLGRQAAVTGLGERALENLDARVYAMRIVRGALSFVGLTGGGEEKIGKAKKILGRAFIGIFIILTSYSVVVFIQRRVTRITFETMFDTFQSCATRTGPATCCQEWNDFQAAASRVTTGREGVAVWEALFRREAAPETEASREAYERWQECNSREREAVGL
ncbi:MAG: hypothetical protein UX17_C0011G0005 [Parcubacteria group bacterium GW2011_GWC2_45_7]|nr:MAG: hypothetical protein UX17_C0011G0005 [Parcubacteria group bacterium GW2011_GWC2_45_7]